MTKAGRVGRYVGGFVVFIVGYAIVATIARIVVTVVNADARGWIGLAVPFFGAALAGGFGAVGGMAAVERVVPSIRLRPIATTFVAIVVFLFAWAALAMAMGSPADDRLSEMAVQSLVAVITAWRISGRHDAGDRGAAPGLPRPA